MDVIACLALSLFFHYVKICQPDHACHTIKSKDHQTVDLAHSKLVSQNDRKNAKTDNIAEGIDLNPKSLLIICPVLFCPGDLAVKHIT